MDLRWKKRGQMILSVAPQLLLNYQYAASTSRKRLIRTTRENALF